MSDNDPSQATERVDYTGLKIGAVLVPVLLVFMYFGKADMGLAVVIVLGMIMVAVKIRWSLRNHYWFWATIVLILILHVPLFLIVRWPQGKGPTLFYTMPAGIVDFLIVSGALRLAERCFSKVSSTNDR